MFVFVDVDMGSCGGCGAGDQRMCWSCSVLRPEISPQCLTTSHPVTIILKTITNHSDSEKMLAVIKALELILLLIFNSLI